MAARGAVTADGAMLVIGSAPDILTEEELTNDNASFPVYHRLSTVIFVSSKQYVEMFTIDPVDLQAALNKDVA